MQDQRVSTATPRSSKAVPSEVAAMFRTVFECPHCGGEQGFSGIAKKSGVVRCVSGICQREFRINVPPYESQFVAGIFIDTTKGDARE